MKKKKPFILFAAQGCGSAIVEAMLAECEHCFELRKLNYESDVIGGADELKALNPLSRVPTLKTPDEKVLTESGAIALYLGGLKKGDRIIPPRTFKKYSEFLRMFMVINTEIYPTFTFADIPSEWVSSMVAQKELQNSIFDYRKELWLMIESWLDPKGPWALGSRMTVIDFYLAVMTYWRPGRDWFKSNTPRIWKIAERVKKLPRVRKVFEWNFPNNQYPE